MHQRAFRIEYWPDKRNVVGRQLAEVLKKQDHAALEPERFATTTVGVQGLPALERMLFGDDALVALARAAMALSAAACSPRSATISRPSRATSLTGWTEGDAAFLARIEHPSEDDEELPSGRDAAGRLLNDLLTATIAMRDMKLLAPLGTSLAKAKRTERGILAQRPVGRDARRQPRRLARSVRQRPGPRRAARRAAGRQADRRRIGRRRRSGVERAGSRSPCRSTRRSPMLSSASRSKPLPCSWSRCATCWPGPSPPSSTSPIGFNALDGD